MRMLMAFGLLAMMAACGEEENENDGTGDARVEAVLALAGDATNGGTVYGAQCESCHGAGATGGSGPNLVNYDESDSEFLITVLDGEGGMPAFDGTLSEQELADVLEYVRSL